MSNPAPLQVAFPSQIEVRTEPLTIAVRRCAPCGAVMGIAFWRGKDALPADEFGVRAVEGEPNTTFCESHGLCDRCATEQAREIDERESRRLREADHSEHPDRDPHACREHLESGL